MPLPDNSAPRRRWTRAALVLLVPAALAAGLAVTAAPAAANRAMPHDPVGKLEHVTDNGDGSLRLRGWAADPDTTANATVFALLDGRNAASARTSVVRPNIVKRRHTGPTPGFDFPVTVPDDAVHTVCVVVANAGRGLSRVLGCVATPLGTRLTGGQRAAHSPTGLVQAARAGSARMRVRGFAYEPDFRAGRIVVVLYVDGRSAQTLTTHLASAYQRRHGAGKRGAFNFSVPVSRGLAHIGCVWVVNTGIGGNTPLGCTAVDTRGAAGSGKVTTPTRNKRVVREAKRHIGQRYVWGAEGPKTFDCSGLVQYSYRKAGYVTPRIAQDQFAAARVIPASRAVPGDLVFYHDAVGAVYHVGIYLRPLETVAAIDPADGVAHQHIWDPSSATYGSFTHT